jgi:hypothetical protein
VIDAPVDHHGASGGSDKAMSPSWDSHGLCLITLQAQAFIFQNIEVAKKKFLTPLEVRENLERPKYTQQDSYSLERKPK